MYRPRLSRQNPMLAKRLRTAKGFMLIEVLVSILLFTIGVLAIIGLQASMTRAQTAAKDRADAAYLSSELIGLMWSDIKNLASYDDSKCSGYGRCADWQKKLGLSLPNGSASVEVSGAGDVKVVVNWISPDGGPHKYETDASIVSN